MGTGTGEHCRCCEEQLDYEIGFDMDTGLCNKCKNDTIPMVLRYLSDWRHI